MLAHRPPYVPRHRPQPDPAGDLDRLLGQSEDVDVRRQAAGDVRKKHRRLAGGRSLSRLQYLLWPCLGRPPGRGSGRTSTGRTPPSGRSRHLRGGGPERLERGVDGVVTGPSEDPGDIRGKPRWLRRARRRLRARGGNRRSAAKVRWPECSRAPRRGSPTAGIWPAVVQPASPVARPSGKGMPALL